MGAFNGMAAYNPYMPQAVAPPAAVPQATVTPGYTVPGGSGGGFLPLRGAAGPSMPSIAGPQYGRAPTPAAPQRAPYYSTPMPQDRGLAGMGFPSTLYWGPDGQPLNFAGSPQGLGQQFMATDPRFQAAMGQAGQQGFGGMGGFGGGMSGEDELRKQREAALAAVARLEGIYGSPQAQAVRSGLMNQASGASQPFSPAVTRAMFGNVASAAAAGNRAEQARIRRGFANAGLTGSGGQLAAEQSSKRQLGRQAIEGKTQIDAQAAMENFAAQERARQQLAQFQQQEAQSLAQATQLGNDLRGRFEVTGEGPTTRGMQALAQAMLASRAGAPPNPNSNIPTTGVMGQAARASYDEGSRGVGTSVSGGSSRYGGGGANTVRTGGPVQTAQQQQQQNALAAMGGGRLPSLPTYQSYDPLSWLNPSPPAWSTPTPWLAPSPFTKPNSVGPLANNPNPLVQAQQNYTPAPAPVLPLPNQAWGPGNYYQNAPDPGLDLPFIFPGG